MNRSVSLVPFSSTYESEEEVAGRESLGKTTYDLLIYEMANDTSTYDWISDPLLGSIGTMC